jgi:anthranilate synthase component 2
MGAAFGGDIVRAPEVMHGKTSPVHHNGTGRFRWVAITFLLQRDITL